MGTVPNYKFVGEYVRSQFERGRNALEEGVYDRAIELLTAALRARGMSSEIEAEIRCSLSEAYEEDANGKQALEAVAKYESLPARDILPPSLQTLVWLRMGLAYHRMNDHSKAISFLNTALKLGQELDDASAIGQSHLALGRSYWKVEEFDIAHDHLERAAEYFRQVGDRRSLAQSYLANGTLLLREGKYEEALSLLESAERLISDKPYYSLLGQIIQNRSAIYGYQQRCREAIPHQERSVSFFERAGQKRKVIEGLNNLGTYHFFLGEIDRSQSVWERATNLATELGYKLAVAMSGGDGPAQIDTLRGNYGAAEDKLRNALTIIKSLNSRWYEVQIRRSLTRLYCDSGNLEAALLEAQTGLTLTEQLGDEHALQMAAYLLCEAKILNGDFEDALSLLDSADKRHHSAEDLMLVGLSRRLRSRILLNQNKFEEAAATVAQSVSAFEALGNKYQVAVSQLDWGAALLKAGNPESAREVLLLAENTFDQLGATADLNKARGSLRKCDVEPKRSVTTTQFSLSTAERLLNAAVARDLLILELVSIIKGLRGVNRIAAVDSRPDSQSSIITSQGWKPDEINRLLSASGHDYASSSEGSIKVFRVSPENEPSSQAIILFVETLTDSVIDEINLLVRLAKNGLELCSLRQLRAPKLIETETAGKELANSVGLLIGSLAMRNVLDAIHRIRSSDVTVLITGESGTGKELVARAVHAESARRDKAFVPFNCTAATRELSDSLLFGHRRGAFTGAGEERQGVVRAADGGTLFLDEIGDLALEVQPKLLRFLQEGEVQPLGVERPVKVDVRVVAATNAELERLVEQGRFREDLFHRLNVIRLRVPALRERREEVPLLARHFLARLARENKKRLVLSDEAADLLQVYDWPGNVRQLSNEIQRVVALAEDGTVITHQHLSSEVVGPAQSKSRSIRDAIRQSENGIVIDRDQPMSDAVSQLEREMLLSALKQNNGNVSRTARQLGLTRRGLHLKRERLGIQAVGEDNF